MNTLVQHGKKLGGKIKDVIVAAGFEPTPGDHPDTWHKFIKRHADTLWQCDFACKKKWTMKGLVDVYFMVFIHIGSRQIWISPCTDNPTGDWTTQQGRNFQMHLEDNELRCEILMRDRDRKYVDSFDELVRSTGCLTTGITDRTMPASFGSSIPPMHLSSSFTSELIELRRL